MLRKSYVIINGKKYKPGDNIPGCQISDGNVYIGSATGKVRIRTSNRVSNGGLLRRLWHTFTER